MDPYPGTMSDYPSKYQGMGCDIHIVAEVRIRAVDPDPGVDEETYAAAARVADALVPAWEAVRLSFAELTHRWYALFSVLADVRNGADLQPISKPRGTPRDASEAWLQLADEWGRDLHSKSWLALDELQAWVHALPEGEHVEEVYQDLAQRWFMPVCAELEAAAKGRPARIVFAFDN